MKKDVFMSEVSSRAGVSRKDAEAVLKASENVIKESLAKGEDMQFIGFGTFTVSNAKGRMGKNPKTGAPTVIPAHKVVRFRAGKGLKDSVN